MLTEPFPHRIIPDFVQPELAWAAHLATPADDWPHWIRYNNDCEHGKLASESLHRLPKEWFKLFEAIMHAAWEKTDVAAPGSQLSIDLRGGGCHVINPGGWLQPHLDYAMHPNGLERRLNFVLYLNPEWHPDWGGRLHLCDGLGKPVKCVTPAFNTAILWECSDLSMHAVEQVTGPVRRVLAAVNYLGPNRGATRRRALFCPRR